MKLKLSPARIFYPMLGTVMGMTVLISGLFAWSTWFETPYLYYQNLPFPTQEKVHAGDAVKLSVERCSRAGQTKTYMTTHTLRNETTGAPTLLPDVSVSIEPGCHRSNSRINEIPRKTAPGIYTVSGVAVVETFTSKREVKWYSEPFEVLPPKD
jgi:hypothetical protein